MKSTATPFLPFFTRMFSTLQRCIALSVLTLSVVSQQLHAVGPMDPAFGAPAAFPAGNIPQTEQIGGMPLPEGVSEADFNAMVSQIQEQLEKMSPEEIEKLQKEAEEMLINSGVSREEIEAFKQGPAGAYPPEGAAQPIVTPPAAAIPEPIAPALPAAQLMPLPKAELPALISESEVGTVLKNLIRHATALREQVALTDALRSLRSWTSSLNDMVFYVKVIDNKAELRKRLTTKEFAPFFEQLQHFGSTLADQASRLGGTAEERTEEENPYDTLRISQNASNKEIKKAAQELLAEKDPEALKKRLTEEGADPLDIKRQVQSARIARAQIKEAYEKLTPPANRKQTDRQLKALREQQKTSEQALRTAATELNRLFSQRATTIIRSAEEFLKKYEPAELARKKEMDAAEAKQRKEQEARAQLKPSPAPYLPAEFYPPAFEGPRPFDAGRAPFTPSSLSGDKGGGALGGPSAKPEGKGGRGGDEGKKDEGKKEEEQKKDEHDKKGDAKGKSKDKKEKTRGPEKELAQLSLNEWFYKVNQFGKTLDVFERNFGAENIVTLATAYEQQLGQADDEIKKKIAQQINKLIGTKSQAELLKGLLITWEDLEQFDDVAKLTPEEKKKFTEHYEKLKKHHTDALRLFNAIAANQAAAAAAAQAAAAQEEQQQEQRGKDGSKKKRGSTHKKKARTQHAAPQEQAQEQLQEEAEQGAPQVDAAVDQLIAKINATNPESLEEQNELEAEVTTFLNHFNENIEVKAHLSEQIQPSLDALRQRLTSYTTIRDAQQKPDGYDGWDVLITRDPKDPNLARDVAIAKKKTEAIGYHQAAQAWEQEILHPTWHKVTTTVSGIAHTIADWFMDMWRSHSEQAAQ